MANLEQEIHLQNSDEITKVNTENGEQLLNVDSNGSSSFGLGDVPQTPPHITQREEYLCISPMKAGKVVSEAVSGNQALGETLTTVSNISDIIKCIVDAPKEPHVCVPQDAENWDYSEKQAQENQEKMERIRRSNRIIMFPVNDHQAISKNQTKKRNKGNKNKF